MTREQQFARRVLVIGKPGPANADVLRALTTLGLRVVVERERGALRRIARGESPHAVLLLDRTRGGEGLIERIRAHPGLERVPVMFCSTEGAQEPSPEEVAELVAAAAAMSFAGPGLAADLGSSP